VNVRAVVAGGLRTVVDSGGIRPELDCRALLSLPIDLLKPNEQEAEMLTGRKVQTHADAAEVAAELRSRGAENVLVTLGEQGAYLLGEGLVLPVPAVPVKETRDQTGCGDQTIVNTL
jgi:fructose-1-phosphate kinase PfkB-like protein